MNSENSLDESFAGSELLASVLEELSYSVILTDLQVVIRYWNHGSRRLFGYEREEILHKPLTSLCSDQNPDVFIMELENGLRTGDARVDWMARQKNGSSISIHTKLKRFYDGKGQVAGISCTSTKSTKHVLEELRNTQKELRALLQEKETLIKEIHHRVRNNLQIVSSLLSLQKELPDRTLPELLRDTRSRIRAISLVYDRLFHSDNMAMIDLAEYLKDLVKILLSSYRLQDKTIDCAFDCRPVSIDPDRAIYAALMVNEILCNSLHHAFQNVSNGTIRVACYLEDDIIHIDLSDNGSGLPETVVNNDPKTLGMQLIQLLAEQLSATIHIGRHAGTQFHIELDSRPTKGMDFGNARDWGAP